MTVLLVALAGAAGEPGRALAYVTGSAVPGITAAAAGHLAAHA